MDHQQEELRTQAFSLVPEVVFVPQSLWHLLVLTQRCRAWKDTSLIRETFQGEATRSLMMFPTTGKNNNAIFSMSTPHGLISISVAVPSAKGTRPARATSGVPPVRCATSSRRPPQQNRHSRTLLFVTGFKHILFQFANNKISIQFAIPYCSWYRISTFLQAKRYK